MAMAVPVVAIHCSLQEYKMLKTNKQTNPPPPAAAPSTPTLLEFCPEVAGKIGNFPDIGGLQQ